MPELPEVETTLRGIAPYICGQSIVRSIVRQPKLRWPISDEIHHLNNKQIIGIKRRAKYLLLHVEGGHILIHLGMSGSLRLLTKFQPAAKHDHLDIVLNNGMTLRYTDPRRFGCWLWFDDLQHATLLQHLGPEPLSDDFSADYLLLKSNSKKTLLKPWIMNNQVVVGVGNIYACESLFLARLSPLKSVYQLTKEESERLVVAIKTVLTTAIAQGGTTLRDFMHSDGKPGYFSQQLQVYGRQGQACFCCGSQIAVVKLAQRSTYYCPRCQL